MTDIALNFSEETRSVNRLVQSLEQLHKAAELADTASLTKLKGAIQALGLSSREQLQQIAAGTASILDKLKADVKTNQVGQIFNPTAIKYNLDAVNQLVRSSAQSMTVTLAAEAGRQAEARTIAAKEGAAKELAAEESKRDGIIRAMVKARTDGQAINAQELRDLEAHYSKVKALNINDANARFQAMTADAQKLRVARVAQLLAQEVKPTNIVSKFGSTAVLSALQVEQFTKTAVLEDKAAKARIETLLANQKDLDATTAMILADNKKTAAERNAALLDHARNLDAAASMLITEEKRVTAERIATLLANQKDLDATAAMVIMEEKQRAAALEASKKLATKQTVVNFSNDAAIARELNRESDLYRAYGVKLAAVVEESNRLVKSTKLEGLFSLHHAVETALATGADAELAIRAQYGSAVVDAIQKNSSKEIRAIIQAREAAAVAAKSGATSIATLSVSSKGSLTEVGARIIDHSKAITDTDKLGDSTKALTRHTHLLNDGFRGLVQSLGMYSASMTAIIPMMAGMAAGMAAIKPLKVGAELEQSMFVIHELAGTTTADMAKVKEAVLEIGASTQYGPLEVAKGLEILTLAGLSTVDALQAIKPVLHFASTGGVTLEAAAETLVAVGTAYRYSAQNFEVVGDVIAKTAADTMASVTDMSAAFKQSTVVAQQYGMSLQDTAQAFGMLAQVGIRGTAAGTSYRNMLMEFNKGSGKAADGIKLLGVELKNADGSAKDLMTTMESLSKGLITKNPVSQGRLLDDIGNERGGKNIAAYQAAFNVELNKSNPLLQKEIDLLIQSGKASEAKRVAEEAVTVAYAKMRDAAAKSAESTGAYSFLVNLEEQFTTLGTYKGLLASLQTDFVKAFDTASDSTKLLALTLRETLNTPEFTQAIAAITNGVLGIADAMAKLAAFSLDSPIAAAAGLAAAFLTAQVAVAALPMALTAAAAGVAAVGQSLGMMAALVAGAFEISAGAAILAVGGVAVAIAAVVTGIGYLIYSVMDSQTAVEKAEKAKREEFLKTASTQTELQEKTINAQQGQLDAEVARINVINKTWIKNRELTEQANAKELQAITAVGGKTSEEGKRLHKEAEDLRAQRTTSAAAEAKAAGEAMQVRIDQWLETKLQIIDAIRLQKEYNLEAAGGMMMGSYSDNLVKIHEVATADTKAAKTFADNAKARAKASTEALASAKQLSGYQAGLDASEAKTRVFGVGVGGYDGKPKFTRSPHVEQVKLETTNILEEQSKRDKLVLDANKNAAANRKAVLDAELAANLITKSRYVAEVQYLEEQTAAATIADIEKQQAARIVAFNLANEKILEAQKEFNKLNPGNAAAIDKNNRSIAKAFADGANKYVTDFAAAEAAKVAIQAKAAADAEIAAAKHKGELKKIDKDFSDWEVSEIALRAKNTRAATNAEALRNAATPRQAAVLTAEAAEFERLTANAEKYDTQIQELTASKLAYEESQKAVTVRSERDEAIAKIEVKTNELVIEQLDKLIARKAKLTGGIKVAVDLKGVEGASEFARVEVARIRTGLTDAIIASGKDGGKGLREMLEAELLTKPFKMVIQAFLQPITTSIAQSVVGSAVGAGGGLASLVGTAGSLGGFSLTGAAAAMNGAAGVALEGGFAMLTEATSMAGAAQGLSQMAGALAPFAVAATVAAGMIERAQGSVTAAGTFAYGHNSDTGFKTGGRADFIQEGGGGTTLNSSWFDPGEATSKYMSAMADLVVDSVKGWADAIGLSVEAVNGYTETVQAAIGNGMTKEQERQSIDKAMAGYGDAMVESVFGEIMAFAKSGETPSATLERLGNDVKAVNNILRENGHALYDSTFESAKAVQLLLNTVGGLDKFTALASTLETVNTVLTKLGKETFELSMDGAMAADALAKSVGGADKLSIMADELIHVNDNLSKLGEPLLDISVASAQAAHSMLTATDNAVKAKEAAEKLEASYASFTANLSGTDTTSIPSLQAAFNKAMAAVTASIPSISGAGGLASVTYDQYSSYTDPQRTKLDTAANAFKNLQDAINSAAKTAQDAAKTAQDAADTAAQAYADALKSVEDSTRDVNRQLRDFGKTDFQKKLSAISDGGQDKQAELDKLSAKAAELSAVATDASLKATAATLGTVSTISNELIKASTDLSSDSQEVADNIKTTLANSTAALGDALTLAPAISGLFDSILAGLLKIPPALILVSSAVQGVGSAASNASGGLTAFGAAAGMAGSSATSATGPVNSVGAAFTAVAPSAAAAGAALSALGAAFDAAGAALTGLTATFGSAAGALDGLNAAFGSAANGLGSLGSAFESAGASGASLAGSLGAVSGAMAGIAGAAAGAAGGIAAAVSALSSASSAAAAVQVPSATSAAAAPAKLADGGYIRGAGTTTSDSIPAMLSDKEFVVRASSVAKYGTGFLDAINAGVLPKTVYREGGNPASGAVGELTGAQKQVVYLDTFSTFLTRFGGVLQTLDATGKELTKAVIKLPESYSDALGTLNSVSGGKDFTGMDSESVSKFFRDLMANNAPTYDGKTWSLSPEAQAALAPFANAGASIDTLLSGLKEREGWQDKLDVLTGKTTDRELALKNDLASTTDAATQSLIRQVYAQEDLNKAREAEAEALKSVQDALTNFMKESSSLEADLNSAFGTSAGDSAAKTIRKDLALTDVRKNVADAEMLQSSPTYAAMSAEDKLKTNAAIQGIRDTALLAEKQYDLNEARQEEIKLLTDSKSRLKSLTDSGASKQVDRMRLLGDDAGADKAQEAIDLADVYKSTADATALLATEGLTPLDKAAIQATITTNDATIAQYKKNAALDAEIEILGRYKSAKEDADSTNIELMRAMGNTAGAAALELANATKGFTDAQIATVRQTNATKGLIAAYGNLSSTADRVTNSRIGLLTAKGDTTGAAALQREFDIKPYVTAIADATATLGTATTQAEKDSLNLTIATNKGAIGNYDLSKSLDKEAQAATDAKAATDALAQAYKDMQGQIEQAKVALLRASGATNAADELEFAIATREHEGDVYYASLYRELVTLRKLTEARQQLNTLEDSALQNQIKLKRANGEGVLANALDRSAFLKNATAPAAAAQAELDRSNVSFVEFLQSKNITALHGLNSQNVFDSLANDASYENRKKIADLNAPTNDQQYVSGFNAQYAITADNNLTSAWQVLEEFAAMGRTASQQANLQSVVDTAQGIAAAYDLNKSLEGQLKIIELQDEAYKQNLDAQKNLADAQKAYADVLKSTISTMKDFISTLDGGASPLQSLSTARANFQTVAGKAAAGDTSAYKDLTPAARTFLDLSKNYSKSLVDYQRDEARVRTTLSAVINANQRELDKLPKEIAAAADPTKDAWIKLQEATKKEAETSIMLTALGVDKAASTKRLRTSEETLADRYIEAVYLLDEAKKTPLLKAFNDAIALRANSAVLPEYTAFNLGDIWGEQIAKVLPPYQMTNEEWNALIATKFPGLVPSDFVGKLTTDGLTDLIRGVMPAQLTVDSLISTTADVSDIVNTKIGEILPANFAGASFNAQQMMQDAINRAMAITTPARPVVPDLATTAVNKVQEQGLSGGTSGTGPARPVVPDLSTNFHNTIQDQGLGGGSSGVGTSSVEWGSLTLEEKAKAAGVSSSSLYNIDYLKDIVATYQREGVTDSPAFLRLKDYLHYRQVPGFAVGTNSVPYDMDARIHKDEVIIPAAFNPERYNRASGNTALVEKIQELTAKVEVLTQKLEAGQNAIAANTGKTARLLNKFDIDGIETRT